MHPELIKATLRIHGTSCAQIARALRVSRSVVTLVIQRRSRSARIERAIARAMRQPVAAVFPKKAPQ